MPGKLIVLEGTDGSGKSTQFDMLCNRLGREGTGFERIIFPQYSEPSSALLRMYLNGEFGRDPSDVNPYAASTFFAVDRYASYVKVWKEYYKGGGLVLSDRYTTSNAVHQASKLEETDRQTFFDWLFDFEYNLLGIPRPDLVVYLDMPAKNSAELLRRRESDTGSVADIHEADSDYLERCREAGRQAALYCGWSRIDCVLDGEIRDAEDIHNEIYGLLIDYWR